MPKLRKKRTVEQVSALDAKIREAVQAETPVTEIAKQLKIKPTYLYTLLRRRLGYDTMLLNEDERAAVRANRRGGA